MVWTSPRTWVAGEKPSAATMNLHIRDNLKAIGDPWTSWTPTLAQGASSNISKTVNYAKYMRAGSLVIGSVKLTASAAGTSGSAITITLPVTAATTDLPCGSGFYYDTGTAYYGSVAWLASTTTLKLFRADTAAAVSVGVGSDPAIAVASTDVFYAFFTYEAA